MPKRLEMRIAKMETNMAPQPGRSVWLMVAAKFTDTREEELARAEQARAAYIEEHGRPAGGVGIILLSAPRIINPHTGYHRP